MAIRGIKTKIALNIALLLLISAVITDILVVVVIQNLWVRSKIDHDLIYLKAMGRLFFVSSPETDNETLIESKQKILSAMLADSDFYALYIADAAGNYFFRSHSDAGPPNLMHNGVMRAIQNNGLQQENISYGRSVFWYQPQKVFLALPLSNEAGLKGAIATVISLTPIYEKLRRYNKPVFYYILFNTLILTIVGLYRIFKIYLRPIDRIIHQAEQYHDEQNILFTFRREDNELNQLSNALNQMLNRISADKEKLKSTVASLERTNTELQRAQDEIIRAEKMASIGRLAAGIAHEIGNPIGIVLGYLDLLTQNDLSDDDRRDFLQRSESEIQRINTTIRQLLDLARPKETKFQNVSVHAILDELIGVMQMQPIMRDIKLECSLKARRETLWADNDQLRQVILNLLLNAADAIHSDPSNSSGRILIATENETGQDATSADGLVVTIEDNGPGIPPESLNVIFDPFYTTKDPGKGTGLGLAVSYTIIEQLGGSITAASQPGMGAVFTIRFSPKDVIGEGRTS